MYRRNYTPKTTEVFEDSLSGEIATKNSWKNLPMPKECQITPLDIKIPTSAMKYIKKGHIPDEMDNWFMYCDENTIRFFRSVTGFCIYIATYEEIGDECYLETLTVNRDYNQYGCTDIYYDINRFMKLLTIQYGGDASEYDKGCD